jgi:hypothetical protein
MVSKIDEKVDELKGMLGEIELHVIADYTLADAIREGSMVSKQTYGWGDGETACALSAAVMAAKARGFME